MDQREYARLELELGKFILKFQHENNIDDEWLLRMLIEEAQRTTVRFKDRE